MVKKKVMCPYGTLTTLSESPMRFEIVIHQEQMMVIFNFQKMDGYTWSKVKCDNKRTSKGKNKNKLSQTNCNAPKDYG
jgi:hypothetical protein